MRCIAALLLIASCCWAQPQRVELRFDETLRVEWPEAGQWVAIDWNQLEDSRCPKGVVCVWEGEVAVHLGVEPAGGDREELILTRRWHGKPDARATGAVGGYLIRLETVNPYPEWRVQPERPEYRAVLVVAPSGEELPAYTFTAVRVQTWGRLKQVTLLRNQW